MELEKSGIKEEVLKEEKSEMSGEKISPPPKHRKRKLKRISKISSILKKSKTFLEEPSSTTIEKPKRLSKLRKLNSLAIKARIIKNSEKNTPIKEEESPNHTFKKEGKLYNFTSDSNFEEAKQKRKQR